MPLISYILKGYIYFCFSLAVCDPGCQNGGTCSAPDVCDCATGYVGDSCQTGEFQCL